MKESPIFTRTYDFILWIIPLTIKFPRQQRFVVAEAIQQIGLSLQELLIEASLSESPSPILHQADVRLSQIRFYLRLCLDLKLINLGQYEHGAAMVCEIGRLLGGWQKSISR
ncbi:MAG: diversity-generating retroelement protein Avd [Chloroflexota bacterium]|jgi:hypothetical protein